MKFREFIRLIESDGWVWTRTTAKESSWLT
jgi:predicted RNA binding protein YcfA (HicA-like mRNA interferase family)